MNLAFLQPLYEQIGDYVSVYLDTDQAEGSALSAIGVRWQDARKQLAGEGADPATLDAAAHAITDASAKGTAVFARNGTARLAAILPHPPLRQIARLAPLPHVMPLLAQLGPLVPHVRVSATRIGGEIVAVGGTGAQWQESIKGIQWPVHKTEAGGWSKERYERSTEGTWDENAKELAKDVTEVAGRIRAQRIVVAGDIRARELLLHHLPVALRESADVLAEEVSADSEAMAGFADQAIAEWADGNARERFDDWHAKLAHGLGVQGLADTMAAFRLSQVADLFLADDPSSTFSAWIGPAGTELGESKDELAVLGVTEPVRDRADAAIARAAACTDAELYFLPPDLGEAAQSRPQDGVCATLRFSVEGS